MPTSKKGVDHRFNSVGNENLSTKENFSSGSKGRKGLSSFSNVPLDTLMTEMATVDNSKNLSPQAIKTMIIEEQRLNPVAYIIIDEDDRTEILKTDYPYNTICLLLITSKSGHSFFGTGFFVSRKCVITAGHCVFNNKNWMESVEVIPGAVGNLTPYGSSVSTRFRSVEGWTVDRDKNFDYGAVILDDENLFQKVGASMGFKPYIDESAIEIAGYPTDKNKNPWKSEGKVKSTSKFRLYYEVDTEEGNSGSPIFIQEGQRRIAVGIHTSGLRSNSGIRLRQEIIDRMTEWNKL